MSAFVVIESLIKSEEALHRYASAAGPTLQAAGAEFLVRGAWQALSGEPPALPGGGLLRFPDRAAALAWYHSSEYQALVELRGQAMESRFRLLA